MRTFIAILLCAALNHAHAADQRTIGLLAGLLQPIVIEGGNIQLEATLGRFVCDYSHGWSLDPPAYGDIEDQGLALHLPYSTGFGIGYRFTDALDLRFEPKLHKYDLRYDGGPRDGRSVVGYRTVTLGIGAYYKWHPFRDKGLTIAPSVRWWPNVWSSLDGDRHEYESAVSGRREIHEVAGIGIAGSPFLANVSVGYEFPF